MSVGQMRTFSGPLRVVMLVGLSACGGAPAGMGAPPPGTTPDPDAARPDVPTSVPDSVGVTPPAGSPDAPSAVPDEGPLPPPPMGGAQVVVEAGETDRENTI